MDTIGELVGCPRPALNGEVKMSAGFAQGLAAVHEAWTAVQVERPVPSMKGMPAQEHVAPSAAGIAGLIDKIASGLKVEGKIVDDVVAQTDVARVNSAAGFAHCGRAVTVDVPRAGRKRRFDRSIGLGFGRAFWIASADLVR